MKINPVKMTVISKLIAATSLIFILTGCTSMNSEFDCPNKPGVTCRSLDQVNSMIDKGMIGKDDIVVKSGATKTCGACSSVNSYANRAANNDQSYIDEGKVRVWVAPYQDINGNYHEASVIRAVVSKEATGAPKEIVEAK